MISGSGPFGRYLGHEGGTLMNRIDTLKKETQGTPCPLYPHHSVVSDSLWPHGLQHTRPPCPSPTLKVHSNSCQWCHPTISSSVIPFSCLQSFPASGSFPMSQFFTSGGQMLEFQLQHRSFQWIFRTDFLKMDWLDLLAVWGIPRVFSNTTVQKHQFFGAQLSL